MKPSSEMTAEERIEWVKQKAREKEPGYVYLIQGTIIPLVKIGYSSYDPVKRLREMQTGSPDILNLVGFMRGHIFLEDQLHRLYQQWRVQGEWFDPTVLDLLQGKYQLAS